MKRTRLCIISVAILSLLLLSCAGKQAKAEKGIVGKWRYFATKGDVVISDSIIQKELEQEMNRDRKQVEIEAEGQIVLEFLKDGRMSNGGMYGSYSFEDDKLAMLLDGMVNTFDYETKGDTLILYADLLDVFEKDIRSRLQVPDSVKIEKYVLTLYLEKVN